MMDSSWFNVIHAKNGMQVLQLFMSFMLFVCIYVLYCIVLSYMIDRLMNE